MDSDDVHPEAAVVVGVDARMPAGAVLRITLDDTSRADAPAEVLASRVIEPIEHLPARFTLRYDPGRVVHTHPYAVRATVSVGDMLAFTTDTSYAVITRGAPSKVDVRLVPVGRWREG